MNRITCPKVTLFRGSTVCIYVSYRFSLFVSGRKELDRWKASDVKSKRKVLKNGIHIYIYVAYTVTYLDAVSLCPSASSLAITHCQCIKTVLRTAQKTKYTHGRF